MTRTEPSLALDARLTLVCVFDLDNTLYDADTHVFRHVDRRMKAFISEALGVGAEEAYRIQKLYYHRYGATLSGLILEHDVDPHAFTDFVHDIPLDALTRDALLASLIAELPGRKCVFTNGSRRHAERVTDALGVSHLFDAFFGIEDAAWTPKPQAPAYARFLDAMAVDPAAAMMFEDKPDNLREPHALGMATALIGGGEARADHIGHAAENVRLMLHRVAEALAADD